VVPGRANVAGSLCTLRLKDYESQSLVVKNRKAPDRVVGGEQNIKSRANGSCNRAWGKLAGSSDEDFEGGDLGGGGGKGRKKKSAPCIKKTRE